MDQQYDVRALQHDVLPGPAARARLHGADRLRRPRAMAAITEPPRVICAATAAYLDEVEQLWTSARDDRLRLLVPRWAVEGPYADHYARLAATGTQVRVLAEPRPQLTLHSAGFASFNRTPHDKSEVVLLRDEAALGVLRSLFDALWAVATPFAGAVPGAVSEADRALLELLATGATDVAVARALDSSERTVRRRVAQLMELYGARSRFQLGVLCAGGGPGVDPACQVPGQHEGSRGSAEAAVTATGASPTDTTSAVGASVSATASAG